VESFIARQIHAGKRAVTWSTALRRRPDVCGPSARRGPRRRGAGRPRARRAARSSSRSDSSDSDAGEPAGPQGSGGRDHHVGQTGRGAGL
jgi:hypothetical protein